MVKAAYKVSNGSAGARTISKIVTQDDTPLSPYRAAKRMKLLGLESTQLPNHRYSKAEQPHIEVPYHQGWKFDVASPNKAWAVDITYLWNGARWACLAIVIDLFGRKPVDWALPLSPWHRLG